MTAGSLSSNISLGTSTTVLIGFEVICLGVTVSLAHPATAISISRRIQNSAILLSFIVMTPVRLLRELCL
jgi:hypothetical protein